MYNHACTDPSCVFCRQSANGNLNVEGIAMYYVQENTIATTMNVQLLFPVFHQNTWPNFLSFDIHGATRGSGGPKISPSSQLSTIQITQYWLLIHNLVAEV